MWFQFCIINFLLISILSCFKKRDVQVRSDNSLKSESSFNGSPTKTPTPSSTPTATPTITPKTPTTTTPNGGGGIKKIELYDKIVAVHESGSGWVRNILKPESMVGDPRNNQGGNYFGADNLKEWSERHRASQNVSFLRKYFKGLFDLRKFYKLAEIYIYGGDSRLEFFIGGPLDNWTSVGQLQLAPAQWNKVVLSNISASTGTRYLRISINQLGNNASAGKAIAIYGSEVDTSARIPIPSVSIRVPRPLMEDFLGTNTFVDVVSNQNFTTGESKHFTNCTFNNFPVTPDPAYLDQNCNLKVYPTFKAEEVFTALRNYTWSIFFYGDKQGYDENYQGGGYVFQPLYQSNGSNTAATWDFDYSFFYHRKKNSNVSNTKFLNTPDILRNTPFLYPDYIKNKIAANGCPGGSWTNQYWGEMCPHFSETKPIRGSYSEKPSDYFEFSRLAFNLAARYGSNPNVATNLLSLGQGQVVRKGLGYIKDLEIWNEPDAWWHGTEQEPGLGDYSFFHPREFAALMSATFDGHKGQLPAGTGMKKADPNILTIPAGIATAQFDYYYMMALWSEKNRGNFNDTPFDVLNFHHYSMTSCSMGFYPDSTNDNDPNTDNETYPNPNSNGWKCGFSPEYDHVGPNVIEPIINFRDRFMPDKPIWITEYGYDTDPNSPQGIKPLPGFSNEEVQGIWNARAAMIFASYNISRVNQFMVRENKDNHGWDSGLWNTSGVSKFYYSASDNLQHYEAKTSYYHMGALLKILKGSKFEAVIDPINYRNLNQDSVVMKFSGGGKTIWAVWLSSSKGINETKAVTVNVAGSGGGSGSGNVELVRFYLPSLDCSGGGANCHPSVDGVKTTVALQNGNVTVNAKEYPIFIVK
ncbi:MAG: glycosyl hydrolase [Bacteriovoracaceae bacterium]|nr:glycosyl hydrolase [Bacteriovoracaceae bacterium]